nr:retrovirus-related Pol polyprotein from transposon TNT 1-94 [Tanacetum cinerariifolium]
KFDGKVDEGFLVGYSVNSKAFRVFNSKTRIVQETLHINFLENKPNVAGIGPKWLFDIDTLIQSMNYQPVVAGNQPNDNVGIQENLNACKVRKETTYSQQYVLLPLWSTGSQDPLNSDDAAFNIKENENDVYVSPSGSDKPKKHDDKDKGNDRGKSHVDLSTGVRDLRAKFEEFSINSTNRKTFNVPVLIPDHLCLIGLTLLYGNNVLDCIVRMTVSRMQLNSKFVNNMLPEWGRFVTAVKLNRGLRDSNYDQLYDYLKQHEAHAKENKMMLDQFSQHTVDPLALMSNVSHQQHYSPSSLTSPFTYAPPYLTRGQGMNPCGGGVAGYGGVQNRVRNANPGQARQVKCYNCNGTCHITRNCTQPKRPQNSEYYKDKMLLMQAQENGVALDADQLLFLAGGHDNAIDDVDEQPVQDLALNVDNVFHANDCDVFDSDVDEAPTAQTMFMANLSSTDPVTDKARPSYDLDILSEVPDHDHYQDVVYAHHEEHAMHDNIQLNHVVYSHADYTNDSNMIPYD